MNQTADIFETDEGVIRSQENYCYRIMLRLSNGGWKKGTLEFSSTNEIFVSPRPDWLHTNGEEKEFNEIGHR